MRVFLFGIAAIALVSACDGAGDISGRSTVVSESPVAPSAPSSTSMAVISVPQAVADAMSDFVRAYNTNDDQRLSWRADEGFTQHLVRLLGTGTPAFGGMADMAAKAMTLHIEPQSVVAELPAAVLADALLTVVRDSDSRTVRTLHVWFEAGYVGDAWRLVRFWPYGGDSGQFLRSHRE